VLPAGVSDEIGACLGILGITARWTVFGDGRPEEARVVIVLEALNG
jgi:hypothetical protein